MGRQVVESLVDKTCRDLALWHPLRPSQDVLRLEYLKFLKHRGAAALAREGGPEHITASCFVVSADLSRVLLAFHRKAQRWLQLGGHIERGDESVATAALREAEEEGGVGDLVLASELPADLDRHVLVGRFGTCSTHWDIGYVAFADASRRPRVSDESEAVRWWTLTDLRANDASLAQRVDHMLTDLSSSANAR